MRKLKPGTAIEKDKYTNSDPSLPDRCEKTMDSLMQKG